MVTTIEIAGMRAVHSVRAVFTALTAVEGIVSADVQLGSATIEHDGRASAEALSVAIALAGCEVTLVREDRRSLPVRGER